jgi:hypothetical protein
MSNTLEEKNEQKTNSKNIPSMSSRQQINYLLKKTQNGSNLDDDEEQGLEVLDYSKYFMSRKEKIVSLFLIYLFIRKLVSLRVSKQSAKNLLD